MVTGFEVHVDAAALADMERAEEAARVHVAATRACGGKQGGKATVASHGPQLANGGKATVASHGPKLANGGKATVASHGPQLANCGKATVASHGPQLGNGGRAGLGKIRKNYKKPNQTAYQQAEAARIRNFRAAKRAAEAKVRLE